MKYLSLKELGFLSPEMINAEDSFLLNVSPYKPSKAWDGWDQETLKEVSSDFENLQS
jgi:hypothetical protein